MTTFKLPPLRKPSDPWGPLDTIEIDEDILYAPFSKSDKLGKTADWTLDPSRDTREQRQRQYGRYRGRTLIFCIFSRFFTKYLCFRTISDIWSWSSIYFCISALRR